MFLKEMGIRSSQTRDLFLWLIVFVAIFLVSIYEYQSSWWKKWLHSYVQFIVFLIHSFHMLFNQYDEKQEFVYFTYAG